jgi:RNA polymerase sigma-70 factor (ECF subfamily)
MLINYKLADGKNIELEVADDIGIFYLNSLEEEKNNDRKNMRRHTPLDSFEYEDARFFGDGSDVLRDIVESETIERAMSCLSERQRHLITKCVLEGWSYTELAAQEGVTEGAVRHAAERALKKLQKYFS